MIYDSYSLKSETDSRQTFLPLMLQCKDRLWGAYEDLCLAVLDIILEPLVVDYHSRPLPIPTPAELGKRILTYQLVSRQQQPMDDI